MKSRLKKLKETRSEAKNMRGKVFVYKPVDEVHKIAIPAGRCKKCNKITEKNCSICQIYICEKHIKKSRSVSYCANCFTESPSSYIG